LTQQPKDKKSDHINSKNETNVKWRITKTR
jgi:hypothetical protein